MYRQKVDFCMKEMILYVFCEALLDEIKSFTIYVFGSSGQAEQIVAEE